MLINSPSEDFLHDVASVVEELEKGEKETRRQEVEEKRNEKTSFVLLVSEREEEERNQELSIEKLSVEELRRLEGELEKRRLELILKIRELLEELENINAQIRRIRTRELIEGE